MLGFRPAGEFALARWRTGIMHPKSRGKSKGMGTDTYRHDETVKQFEVIATLDKEARTPPPSKHR